MINHDAPDQGTRKSGDNSFLTLDFSPGDMPNPVAWRLVISREGLAMLTTCQLGGRAGGHAEETISGVMAAADLDRLRAKIKRCGFRKMEERYSYGPLDHCFHTITVNDDTGQHTVVFYGVESGVEEGHGEAKRFLSLWRSVARACPFPLPVY